MHAYRALFAFLTQAAGDYGGQQRVLGHFQEIVVLMTPKHIISRPLELSLRLMGLWPHSSITILQRCIWTLSLTIFLTFQYWHFFTHFKSADLPDLLDGLSITLSNTLLFLKLMIIWFNTRIFYGVLKIIAEDWDGHASSEWSVEAMTNKAVLSTRFTKLMIGMYTMAMLSRTASVLAPDGSDATIETKEKKFLVKMEFPFDPTVEPIYQIVFLAQLIVETFAAYMAGMMLALIATLILHVSSQIDVMCRELEEISNLCRKQDSCLWILKSLIKRHQRIILLSDNIEIVFSYISLMQFLSNTLVICFLGFVIVSTMNTEEGTDVLVTCLPYYVIVNIEAFILCFTGEYLSSKGDFITYVAYNSHWYELNPRESRMILLVLLRTQKRLTITAGKFMNLSLETFARMLKASASYVSVLHAMY